MMRGWGQADTALLSTVFGPVNPTFILIANKRSQ